MEEKAIIYCVDDDESVHFFMAKWAKKMDLTFFSFSNPALFLSQLPNTFTHNKPCCIITDFYMPEMNGLQLLKILKEQQVDVPVIMMTGHADVPMLLDVMRTGVFEFIEKPLKQQEVNAVISKALSQQQQQKQQQQDYQTVLARFALLSPRERDALTQVVAGKTNKIIARELNISFRTVEKYRARMMQKMQVDNVATLTYLATKYQLK